MTALELLRRTCEVVGGIVLMGGVAAVLAFVYLILTADSPERRRDDGEER